jgi:hypothetical protein
VLCQLSYGPRLGTHCRRGPRLVPVARSPRRSLGSLFLLIAAGFAGIAVYAASAGGTAWVLAVAAALLGLWMGEQALRAFR